MIIRPHNIVLIEKHFQQEILAQLKEHVEDKDMIFVAKIDKDAVASLTPGVIEWINKM